MARKPRIEFPGAFFHVLARGNQKQNVFLVSSDYEKYLLLIWSQATTGKSPGHY